jgi:uncharacterized membrane protein
MSAGTEYASMTSHFTREMMVSIAPLRYFAIAVFSITIVKMFGVDPAELDRLYRVLSVAGLGVTLVVTSYPYQRRRV